MYIVNQTRDTVTNLDCMDGIVNSGKKIVCGNSDGVILLAEYETEERTEEIFKQMLKEVFPAWVKNDILGEMIMNRNVYYMPEV